MVIIDTSIIIDHLRQAGEKQTVLRRIIAKTGESQSAVSIITIQELFEVRSTRSNKKRSILAAILKPLLMLPYTEEITRRAGELARDGKQPLEFADAAIAATALTFDASLATLNIKHFKPIPQMQLFTL